MIEITYKLARRIVIFVVGVTVLVVGIIMLVTPGPALVVIPMGLAILGMEFAWARYWLHKLRRSISVNNLNGRLKRAVARREQAENRGEGPAERGR
jgi:uncharacterized protein (TIGR02611 family)